MIRERASGQDNLLLLLILRNALEDGMHNKLTGKTYRHDDDAKQDERVLDPITDSDDVSEQRWRTRICWRT